MNEIIHVKNDNYGEYEQLLLTRDNLKKEAVQIKMNYMAIFGDMLTELFEKNIECIKKKKLLHYYQLHINKGLEIDERAILKLLEQELAEYYKKLDEMIVENEAAHGMKEVDIAHVAKVKKLYRKLAKLIHPDINPKTDEIKQLRELWDRIQICYNSNNLNELMELEVLVMRVLEEHDISSISIDIPDIGEKIERLGEEIEKIKSTNPYLYKYLLADEKKIEERKKEIEDSLKEYIEYSEQLDEMIEDIRGGSVWHMS